MQPPPPTRAIEEGVPDLADPELRRRLFQNAFNRLRDGGAADDAVQETLTRAAKRWSKFDPTIRPLACWVFGILHLVLREMYRDRLSQPLQASTIPQDWSEVAAREETVIDLELLATLLEKLSESSRHLVTMHHLENLSHQEIATRLGITTLNSRVRVSRAMKELRQLAAGEGSR